MDKKILRTFSIMPLNVDYIDNLCEDMKYQHELGIIDCFLFSMSLHPEGTPPIDKLEELGKKYLKFKKRLDEMGLKNGILVQSTIGHGYALAQQSPFKKIVNLNDGKTDTTCCPYDDDFCEYIKDVMVRVAELNPEIIMLDDDFRLIGRMGNGCACEMHMEVFNKAAGTKMSREELYNVIKNDNKSKYADIYVETQRDSLLKCAKAMREGIDSINPSLQVAFCSSGNYTEFASDITKILAGKGNPIAIRISNGVYVPEGIRGITYNFYKAAQQVMMLRDTADVIMAEADTIPWNQYGMSAQWYHSHYVGSVLEGVNGAKRWITRLKSHEPISGLPYRKLLNKYKGFYDELARLSNEVEYMGCKIPLAKNPRFIFGEVGWRSSRDGGDGWGTCLLERIGLPLYFSEKEGGVAFLNDMADQKFSDDEIIKMLGGVVVLASDTAKRLIERGFGEYIGVDVSEWKGERPNVEIICESGGTCGVQKNVKKLTPLNDEVKVESMVYHRVKELVPLFPGTTVYKNSLGGTVAVYAGTPVAEMNYIEGFSFLNYSRKEQIVNMLSRLGKLPVYYTGTEEVYLKSGLLNDEKVFCSLFNLGLDIIEEISLKLDKDIESVEFLDCDGTYKPCKIRKEDGNIIIEKEVYTLNPVILILK